MAAGIFGSVEHTKVTRAWAFHEIWEWPRKECWGWTLTLVWNQNTICYNKLLMSFHKNPMRYRCFKTVSQYRNGTSFCALFCKTLTLRPTTFNIVWEAARASTTTGPFHQSTTSPCTEVKRFSSWRKTGGRAREEKQNKTKKRAASHLPGEATTTTTATIYWTTHHTLTN